MYVKCLQFYISYFSGVEGTGTTVTHCECWRGRKAEAKGKEVWLQWEGNQTASPRCNWKILASLKKYRKIIPGGVGFAGASQHSSPSRGTVAVALGSHTAPARRAGVNHPPSSVQWAG